MSWIEKLTKNELTSGLTPIRYAFLAQTLYFCFQNDLFEYFLSNQKIVPCELASEKKWDEYRTKALLQYLANEGYLEVAQGDFMATERCRAIKPIWPWYRLLIGGYGDTLNQLCQVMETRSKYASRNGAEVGVGSCGISQHDALPMTIELLESIRNGIDLVVDIGCGDGSFLLDLCEKVPHINALGIEPELESVDAAKAEISRRNLVDRVQVIQGSASDIPFDENDNRRVCYLTAFVLQEILEQRDEDTVRELISSRINRHAKCYWVVVEVRNDFDVREVMQDKLALSYYNPYYLIHCLTEQRLEKLEVWEDLFDKAGASILRTCVPDPSYDDLGLKIGFLLEGRNRS